MSLQSLQLGQAWRLVMRTLPIAMVRLGVSLAFWLAAVVYMGVVGGLAFVVGQGIPWLGVIVAVVGLGGLGWLYSLAQRYVLYLVKAAQIAVMAEMLTGNDLPAGANQLAWGKARVQARFGEVSGMFVVDQMVTAVVRGFTRLMYTVASWLPGDTLKGLARMAGRVVHYAVTYVDEAILARTFWRNEGSVWAGARDGVVLYAMVWKPLLLNAVALMLLSYIPGVLVLALVAGPLALLGSAVSPAVATWSVVAAVVLSLLVKAAVGDSFAMAAMIAAYQRATEGLEPDMALTARLSHVKKFGELSRRADEDSARVGGPVTQRLDSREAPAL